MIMRAPTPYVPQRPFSVPAPANNFHLRQPRRRRQGMGDVCVSGPYGSDANGPLCLDQTTGSPVNCSDPRCGAGSGGGGTPPPQNMGTFIPAPTPTFATIPFGNSSTTTFNLETQLQQLVQQITAQSPASLANQGITPSTMFATFMAEAQGYCAEGGAPLPDCGNMAALVSKYASQAAGAFSSVPASQFNPATYTAYAPASRPQAITSPGPAQLPAPPMPPIPAANPPVAPITPPPVVNPPAAASNGVNQQTVGNGAGQSNSFNPATLIPDVSTVPDWVWYAGGGLLALVVISSLGKR